MTGEVDKVRERGTTSGAGVLADYGHDDLGRRISLTRGNGATTGYQYDDVSRLKRIEHGFTGTAHDVRLDFLYNPASQIVSTTRTNPSDPAAPDLYAWTGHGSGTTASTADGRNRLDSHGGATPTHDARGNLTYDGTFNYTYSSENLMTSGANSGPLVYDPLMRFYKNFSTTFVHDADGQLIGDYYNGNIVGRYVPGAAEDEPVALVDKFGARTGFHADERGSVIAGSNASGANSRIVTYDEYGRRGAGGSYRFAYTGQVHLINDLYDYKSRNYLARVGRFPQPDRIGYGDGMNLYAYVGGDPVNKVDPSGTQAEDEEGIISTGIAPRPPRPGGERSWDWMGIMGRAAGGRLEAMRYERQQEQLRVAMLALELSSDPDGNKKFICLTPIECARELRDALVRLQKKPKPPHDPPRRGEFARAAGFEKGLKKSEAALAKPFNTDQIVRNLKSAHFTMYTIGQYFIAYPMNEIMTTLPLSTEWKR